MAAGAPTKISAEIIDQIINSIKLGAYIETACAYAGVSKDTFYRWLKKAARSGKDSLYSRLSDAVEKAQAESELRSLMILEKASQEGQWQAAAWRLERKFPDKWGRREKVELSGKDGGPIEYSNLNEEDLRARAAKIAERLKGSS